MHIGVKRKITRRKILINMQQSERCSHVYHHSEQGKAQSRLKATEEASLLTYQFSSINLMFYYLISCDLEK